METLKIGQLADSAGVGVETVRFYEQQGLLPKLRRNAGGYRLYPEAVLGRLQFVRRAKQLGFSLQEIKSLLKLQDSGGSHANVKKISSAKLAVIEEKIRDLTSMRKALSELVNLCEGGSGDLKSCPIIQSLSGQEFK